jgi:transcriptional regulator with XRE-family HTH domain
MTKTSQPEDTNNWRLRLRAAIDASGMKHSLIALDAGMTPETLSRILTAEHQRPSLDSIRRIAHAVHENVGWVLGEAGFELSADEWTVLGHTVRFLDRALFKSPLPHTIVEARPNALRVRTRVRDMPPWAKELGARITCQIVDDSLRDAGVLDGDLIHVKPHSDPHECRETLVACRIGGELYAKKLTKVGAGFRLLSFNERYAPLYVEEEELEMLGVAVGRSGALPARMSRPHDVNTADPAL